MAFQHADAALKAERELVLTAVKQTGLACQYADAVLQAAREFVLEAAKLNGLAFQYAAAELRLTASSGWLP